MHRFAAILAMIVALPGCSRIASDTAPAADTGPSDTLRVAMHNVNSINPLLVHLAVENWLDEAVFSGLVKLDARGRMAPDLALAVPTRKNGGISADGRTLIYRLRRGVLWQDGAPLTAADVVFTFDKIMDPHVNSAPPSAYFDVASVTAPDPLTVVVRLKQPSAVATQLLFCNGEGGEIVPRHLLAHSADINHDPFGRHPVGSGPYAVMRWDPDARILLRANPSYFGGRPKIPNIDVEIMNDPNTELTALLSHAIDFTANVPHSQLFRLRSDPALRTATAMSYFVEYVAFNTRRAPVDDRVVRTALIMSADRAKIAQRMSDGVDIPADSLISPDSWAHVRNGGAQPYDPKQAAALLAASGWHPGGDGVLQRDGKRLAFTITAGSDNAAIVSAAQQLQSAWRALGADASVRMQPENVLYGPDGPERTGAYDVFVTGFGNGMVDPDSSQVWRSNMIPPAGFNDARLSDADIDRWSDLALAAPTQAERARLYALIQERLGLDAAYMPLAWVVTPYAYSVRLRGFSPEAVNSDFWNVQDWSLTN
jgi:peptide/nickel transport system substrate-binding protein